MEVNHSFRAMQDMQHMTHRWDGCPFLPTEKHRAMNAGKQLAIRGVLCEERGDLPERCLRVGVKTQQGHHGCLECTLKPSLIHSRLAEVTLTHTPWQPRTQEVYFEELLTHLVAAHVTTELEKRRLCAGAQFLHAYPWGRVVTGRTCSAFYWERRRAPASPRAAS